MVNWTDEYDTEPRNVQGWVPRAETPLAGTNIYTRPTHQFLLRQRNTNDSLHPLEVMHRVRSFVSSRPETSATFQRKDVATEMALEYASMQDGMFRMCGAWPGSEYYMGQRTDGRYVKWVNPNYIHRVKFSDAIVKCECGTLVIHDKTAGSRSSSLPHDEFDDHTDECLKSWRWRSRADLYDNRRRILKESLHLGLSGRETYARLGLADQGTISHVADGLGLRVQEEKEYFNELRRNTILELLTLFSPDDIGQAYGLTGGRVREIVSTQTDYDLTDFYSVRRKNAAIINEMDENAAPKPVHQ